MGLSPFFEGLDQVEVEARGFVSPAPARYPDVGLIEASFPARLGALRRLLPDPRFVPMRVAPGIGVITIDCFEYRACDFGPYNEVAISILLAQPAVGGNLPGRQLAGMMRRRQGHAFVLHLPVTTEAALALGVDFYALPKFLADITFRDGRVCHLAEGRSRILTLTGDRIATSGSRVWQSFAHSWMNGQPQCAEVRMNQLAHGISWRPGAARIELGDDHPIAQELRGLLLSRKSIHYSLVPRQEAILHGPEHWTVPLLRRVMTGPPANAADGEDHSVAATAS